MDGLDQARCKARFGAWSSNIDVLTLIRWEDANTRWGPFEDLFFRAVRRLDDRFFPDRKDVNINEQLADGLDVEFLPVGVTGLIFEGQGRIVFPGVLHRAPDRLLRLDAADGEVPAGIAE